MAFISDVMAALAQRCVDAAYPNGMANASVTGHGVRCFVGWPLPDVLKTDLAAGNAQVSVYPVHPGRGTTRFQADWVPLAGNAAATLTVTVSGSTITLGGSVTAGNMVALIIAGVSYAYVAQASDSLASVAAALLALIQADVPAASASAAVITLPGSLVASYAATGASGLALLPLRTAEQMVQISAWAPVPVDRDTLVNAIDAALAAVLRLPLPDGTMARVMFHRLHYYDAVEKSQLFRGELFFRCEYTVVAVESFTPVLLTTLALNNVQFNQDVSRFGRVNLGAGNMALFLGPTQPTLDTPWLWFKTDKAITDPTFKVILEMVGP